MLGPIRWVWVDSEKLRTGTCWALQKVLKNSLSSSRYGPGLSTSTMSLSPLMYRRFHEAEASQEPWCGVL